MPSLRGISLSVVTLAVIDIKAPVMAGFGVFPEFPHPDCSQSVNTNSQRPSAKENLANYVPDLKAETEAALKTRPRRLFVKENVASVYIPSAPCKFSLEMTRQPCSSQKGTRFWIRYRILPRAAKSKYYYFKLFMNGREITSWGCDVEKQADGEITRALFDPVVTDDNCYSDDATGIIYKKMGLERRVFLFMKEAERRGGQISAAADGGLLEVRIYRSSNRARRVQEPAIYKSQEPYGIKYVIYLNPFSNIATRD
jgi:hypothetical protein